MPDLPYRTKLIEVSLPLEAMNEAASREKSIRHGHPSTLHLWWSRKPLAATHSVDHGPSIFGQKRSKNHWNTFFGHKVAVDFFFCIHFLPTNH